MDRWVKKVAVVTGANAGIGAKLAETLVKQGVHVSINYMVKGTHNFKR